MGVTTVGVTAAVEAPVETKPHPFEYKATMNFVEHRIEGCQNVEGVIYLRRMKVSDYNQIRAILPKVTRCNDACILDEAVIEQLINAPTFFPFVIMAREAPDAPESLVGYAEIHRLPHLGRGMDGRLEKVLVLESWRGKKIAQCVCAELVKIARDELGCVRIDLTVEKPDAMTVYRKLGFVPVETNVWRLYF